MYLFCWPFHRFEAGESPLDYLQNAIHCYATAIKHRAKDANLHLQLALTLEEKYHAEDILGMKDVEVCLKCKPFVRCMPMFTEMSYLEGWTSVIRETMKNNL